jgi:tRNA pseudouridine38-40 synthase
MQDRKPGHQARQSIEKKRNIRLTLAFEGTAYHGWQIQDNSPTLQGLLSEAIARITGEKATLTGSGRTDAGTHARGLVANFFTGSRIAPGQLIRALNSILPRDIRVLSARQVPLDFHARRDAVSKVYRYQIYLGSVMPPHLMREHFHYPFPIDISKMVKAARLFLGEHDFASFAKTNSSAPSTIRRIYRCELKKQGSRLLFTVEGNGFLHHMVRNMAGTLLEVGRGSISLDDFHGLFSKRDRRLAGFTAPAHGLILLKVKY